MVRLYIAVLYLAFGCGGGTNDDQDPCDACFDFESRTCYVSGDIRACVATCDIGSGSDGLCSPGHACIPYNDISVCNPSCDDSLCDDRTACRAGECVPVACASTVPCLSGADVCDLFAHMCYPFDGTCSADDDCPQFDGQILYSSDIDCESGYCTLHHHPPDFPPLEKLDVPEVTINGPLSGSSFSADTDVSIDWQSPVGGAALVSLLVGTPVKSDDLRTMAVWGASVSDGRIATLRLSDGVAVQGGVWTQMRANLPTVPLTMVVQIVRDGVLVGVSRMIRFRVGSDWGSVGDPCSDPGVIEGQCSNPSLTLGCDPISNRCASVCESYRDCLQSTPIEDCGPPRGDARYCE